MGPTRSANETTHGDDEGGFDPRDAASLLSDTGDASPS